MRAESLMTYALLALTLTASCARESLEPVTGEPTLTLSLDPGQMALTKASEYGSDDYNENEIQSFRLYFYTSGADEDTEAVYVWPESGFASLKNTAATQTGAIGTDPTTGKVSVSLTLNKTLVAEIFPSDATACTVYAVANISGAGTLPDGKPGRSELKSTVITAEFGPTTSTDPYAEPQSSFVMDGEGTLTRDKANFTISGSVKMYRATSKITFTVSSVTNEGVEDTDGDGFKDWEPLTDNMRVYYVNGINRGYLNGTMARADREIGLFNYKSSGKGRVLTGDATTGWTHALPFYSYYNYWRPESGSATGDEGDAPYLLLSMPWRHRTADSDPAAYDRYFTCWYAVPFNTITGHLERNAWYKVSLSVSILGSGDPDSPTLITPSYMILPWGNETVKTNAELLRYRYLMVDKNEYTMNNVNSLTIPYYTSHPVTVTSSSMTRTVLKPSSGYQPYEQTVSSSSYTLVPNSDNSGLVFTHNLVNDYSSDYDVTAYSLTFTIQHSDDASFTETITVVQYPALYVVASLNSDCSSPDKGTSGNNNHHGYVYLNGSQSTGSGWNYVSNLRNAGNKDPYMYVVTVSSLPTGSSYIIGDPRTEDTDNFYNFSRAAWLYGSNHRLTYYYSADTDGDRVNNMIAPSFRIASSYGVTTNMSYSDAKKRCASYQEDGYPAGRWRIPTKAEIEYMVMLAEDGKIPILLSTDSYYWGSNNTAYRANGGTSTSNSFVRCVYDEWYWKDKCTKTTFTWGDKER
jgi:hypothetical protein